MMNLKTKCEEKMVTIDDWMKNDIRREKSES